MPDKRQSSKQRRAARNRAARGALAARVSAAETSARTSRSPRSAAVQPDDGNDRASARAGRGPSGTAPRSGLFGAGKGRRRPGDLAVLIALGLAVVSAITILFQRVDVDDRGEPLPTRFKGVAITAIEASGREVGDETTTLVEAIGAQVLLFIALPLAVAAFAFWANRRPDRSRLLTFALIAMAISVLFSAGVGLFFFPTMIALAVASFQVRRAEMPARVAERATAGRGRGRVVDAESSELDEDASDGSGGPDDDLADDDPLAELEAEIEAEEQSRRDGGGSASG